MKKKRLLVSVLALGLFFCACGKEKADENGGDRRENLENSENWQEHAEGTGDGQGGEGENAGGNYDPDKAVLFYEAEDPSLLCAGEEGTLYAYCWKKFCEYDASGQCVKEYPVKESSLYALSYWDGTLYYINGSQLCAMDLETGTSEAIHTFDGDMFMFGRMVALKDSVFIIRKAQYNEEWADVCFEEGDGYVYEGEELLCFHPSTGEVQKPDIPNIKQINRKNEKELLVYAYDEEGGFYFTVYHTDGTTEEKRYTGRKFGAVNDIAYDEGLDRIVCEDFDGVFLTKLEDLSGKAYAYENSPAGYNTLTCADGFTYQLFTVGNVQRLVRLENRLLVRNTPTLKGYTLSTFYEPQRYGYPINCEKVLEDEMAMILLAGDSDYDFLILDSSHPIAGEIRRTGAYYPLNSLGALDALLNDSHPYVREGATTKDGELWMLPLNVECPLLLYNEDLIGKYGITVADFSTYTKLLDATLKLPGDGSVLFSIPYLLLMWDVENQYLGNYAIKDNRADFHREEFQTYLETRLKLDGRVENNGNLVNNWSIYQYVGFQTQKKFFSHMLYSMIRSTEADGGPGFRYDRYDFIRALPAPGIKEGEKFKNQAQALMLVVNPNSKRLQWVLEYLGEVCEGIRKDEYSLMLTTNDFSGKPLWQDMQAILADAEIYFKYPYEMIHGEIMQYVREEQSYEDTVNEMERKMNMYLNE